jgi:Na+-transporting NADH:ubiquinone oxidoreductase subunit NqrC
MNKIKMILLIASVIFAITSVVKVNALDKDEVILCVANLKTTKQVNDVICRKFNMDDVDLSNDKFVKDLFSHNDSPAEPDYPNAKYFEKASLK